MLRKVSFTGARDSWPSLQRVGWARLQVASCVGLQGLARQGYRLGLAGQGYRGGYSGRATGSWQYGGLPSRA